MYFCAEKDAIPWVLPPVRCHTQYRNIPDGSVQHLSSEYIMLHQHYIRTRNHCRSITADCVGAGSDYLSLPGDKSRIQKISGKLITWQWWDLSLPGESTTWQWFKLRAGSDSCNIVVGSFYNMIVIYPYRVKPLLGSDILHITASFCSRSSVFFSAVWST